MIGLAFGSYAQKSKEKTSLSHRIASETSKQSASNKVYFTTSFDGNVFGTSMFTKHGVYQGMTTVRYTTFMHVGTNMHYNFNKYSGLFVGLNFKNIGFIEKYENVDSTAIRRAFTVGVPVGLKFGNMDKGNALLIGGGVDLPFHYKEKGFIKRNNKEKTREWFSNRTATYLPYVFVGIQIKSSIVIKAQYYPTNFMNPDFTINEGGVTYKPYDGYNVNLLLFSLGFNLNYTPKYIFDSK